jgi:hypothetical protein
VASSPEGHKGAENVWFADRDMTSFPGTYCQRLDRIELAAKAAWYITRSLRELRKRLPPIPPP